MNKHEFIAWLRSRLSDVPPQELDRVAGFYASAIDERVEDGMDEAEAIHALGEPEALLQEIHAAGALSDRTSSCSGAARQKATQEHADRSLCAHRRGHYGRHPCRWLTAAAEACQHQLCRSDNLQCRHPGYGGQCR